VSPELAALVARFVLREPGSPQINVRAECARIGVSTSCFYKYVKRYRAEGVDGFFPRSRAPSTQPTRVSAAVEGLIVQARKQLIEDGWDAGADSIGFWLLRLIGENPDRWPSGQVIPSRATINRVLDRRGQILRVPQRKPRAATRRFQAANPNSCWQMDGFGWTLDDPDATAATVLHIIDDCSRYEIALDAMVTENAVDVWASVQAAARSYGLPAWFLTDNGTAFSGQRRGWTSDLDQNLTALGVGHLTSSVGHPQTCGKCERAHQTVQRWLEAHRPYRTLAELQAALDTYRAEHNQRPRTHLDGLSPAQRYRLGTIDGPSDRLTPPLIITTAKVAPNGAIKLNKTSVSIGRRYAGSHVTVFRQGPQTVIFGGATGNQLIAEFQLKNRAGYQSAHPRPRGKVSTKS
jgi:transposase InsO family protein